MYLQSTKIFEDKWDWNKNGDLPKYCHKNGKFNHMKKKRNLSNTKTVSVIFLKNIILKLMKNIN